MIIAAGPQSGAVHYSEHMKRLTLIFAMLAAAATAAVLADEGMWTTHNFPRDAVRQKYNVNLDDAWLQKLQRSVVRLETGCTGSFVSPDGLILTNHHCAQSCLAENSTAARDLVANGFVSPDRAEEIKCQGEAISVLTETEDVTPAVMKAIASVPPADAARIRNETLTDAREPVRGGVEEDRHAAQVRKRVALSGRPILALQVQAL